MGEILETEIGHRGKLQHPFRSSCYPAMPSLLNVTNYLIAMKKRNLLLRRK